MATPRFGLPQVVLSYKMEAKPCIVKLSIVVTHCARNKGLELV